MNKPAINIDYSNLLKGFNIPWVWSIVIVILPVLSILMIESELDTLIILAASVGVIFSGLSIVFPKM